MVNWNKRLDRDVSLQGCTYTKNNEEKCSSKIMLHENG